jgi:DNA-binding response OmpR family regulator
VEAGTPTVALWLAEDDGEDLGLAILDVRLPVMHGAELATRLRTIHPQLPVLFVTAGAPEHLRSAGMLPAGAPVLEKPFSMPELIRSVNDLLRDA